MAKLKDEIFVFRADASTIIGSGHIMRCLALADAIANTGGHCHFICRPQPGSLEHLIKQHHHRAHLLPPSTAITPVRNNHPTWLSASWQQDADDTITILARLNLAVDWLIVDHYALDYRWHYKLRSYAERIAVIDDLADRPYECDLLIDHTLNRHKDHYRELVPNNTYYLLGSQHALLRPVFAQKRQKAITRRAQLHTIKRVFISMGSNDLLGATRVALDILKNSTIAHDCEVDILLGQQTSSDDNKMLCSANFPFKVNLHESHADIHELMLTADIAFGAGGTTAWERCCLGLPSFLITVAHNQHDAAQALHQQQAAIWLGDIETINVEEAIKQFNHCINDLDKIRTISTQAASVCDGEGCLRVLEYF